MLTLFDKLEPALTRHSSNKFDSALAYPQFSYV